MAWKQSATAQEVVDLLNELLKLDRQAITNLMEYRTVCNESIADHPTVQTRRTGDKSTVGLLGVLNGLFGVNEEGSGPLVIEWERGDESMNDHVVKFDLAKPEEEVS